MTNEADFTRRLIELERRMDLLFDHPRLDEALLARRVGEPGPRVQALLERGDKLAAISLVREQTGMGASEAKRTVEQMMCGS